MKWIGQHIWDFISRFRTTVYLENLETSSEENVLVVDSDGKVTKNTTLGGSDLTITNASDNRVVTSTGGSGLNAESGVTYDGTTFAVGGLSYIDASELLAVSGNDASSTPALLLQNNHTGAVGPALNFAKTASGEDDDQLGKINFSGKDDGNASQTYAEIECYIADASAGAEEGKLILSIASHDGELQPGLTIASGDAEDEVDVTIGNGATSLTTIAGNLTVTGTPLVGWHGSTTRIKILHSDFVPDDVGRPIMVDDTDAGSNEYFLETFSTAPAYTTVVIPTGYKATHVKIEGDGTPAVTVFEGVIDDKVFTSKGTGNVNTEINITDVTSSTTNYLFIKVAQGASDEIYGGYVTIATV